MSGYENLKVSELRVIAKSLGLRGWSRMKKDNLISFIKDNEFFESDKATEVARSMNKRTVKELKSLAQLYGIKICSRANKSEIIYLLGETTVNDEVLFTKEKLDYGTQKLKQEKSLINGIRKSVTKSKDKKRTRKLRDGVVR